MGVRFRKRTTQFQDNIHYAMSLRHMLNDSLVYLKECNEIIAINRKEQNLKTSGEFLSGIRKEDRLHPIVSICVYYGEEDWDGPMSLVDMLEITEELKTIVQDYSMNLVQVKKSEDLHFQNKDITTVFDMIRFIYNRDYDKMNEVYEEKSIDTELALVIGSITKSQKIIDQALKLESEGEQMQMCRALQELEQRGVEAGRTEGIESGEKGLLKRQVKKKLAKGKNAETIADELEEEVSAIQPVIDEILAEKQDE